MWTWFEYDELPRDQAELSRTDASVDTPCWEEDLICPVMGSFDEAIAKYGIVFISANLRTYAGQSFYGVVSLTSSRAYALELWTPDGEAFGFNENMPDWATDELDRLRNHLDVRDDPVFPIQYQSAVRLLNGQPLEGMFSAFDPTANSLALDIRGSNADE